MNPIVPVSPKLFSKASLVLWVSLSLAASPSALADPPKTKKADFSSPAAGDGASDRDQKEAKDAEWKKLRGKFVECQFGGDGPVEIGKNVIKFGYGDPLTGIRWEGDVIKENYEIELEARRTDGFDFFCGLTFPVGEDHVSFILGGWGGGVVGISSVDGRDASENDTTSFRNFDNDRWYKVRVRVDPENITCWIDDKEACQQPREGHEFDIRYEMDQCVPLGLAAFQCKAEYKNLKIRKLDSNAKKSKTSDKESSESK